LSIKGYCKTRPHRSYCFLSMFKLRCKRHYRNLATYSWCTRWREHVTKTAPARRRHSVCGGGGDAPISYDRRRRRQQNVGGGGAAAAAHSSSWYMYRAQGRVCGMSSFCPVSSIVQQYWSYEQKRNWCNCWTSLVTDDRHWRDFRFHCLFIVIGLTCVTF